MDFNYSNLAFITVGLIAGWYALASPRAQKFITLVLGEPHKRKSHLFCVDGGTFQSVYCSKRAQNRRLRVISTIGVSADLEVGLSAESQGVCRDGTFHSLRIAGKPCCSSSFFTLIAISVALYGPTST